MSAALSFGAEAPRARTDALRNASEIEKYWREKGRDDIRVWVSYSSESHAWEVYSNLVNGWPRPIKGVRS